MNPPYGRVLGKWMAKAVESWRSGATVVCLIPARTDTAWWHDFVMQCEIRFIRGRLRFVCFSGWRRRTRSVSFCCSCFQVRRDKTLASKCVDGKVFIHINTDGRVYVFMNVVWDRMGPWS